MLWQRDKRSLNTIAPGIYTIADVLSFAECVELIDRAERIGFAAATVGRRGGGRMMPQVRNNDRVILEDLQLAGLMWERIRALLPQLDRCEPRGVDHTLRFYRYSPGQQFRRHRDGVVKNPLGESSKLSYLIYLNEDCKGGETTFHSAAAGDGQETQLHEVKPSTGMAILFRHEFWHAGYPVTSGQKYLLRTDVFYRGEQVSER